MARAVSSRWFGANAEHRYFDWGGFRYRVTRVGPWWYRAFCNGQALQDRFKTLAEAMIFVEETSGYRGKKVA